LKKLWNKILTSKILTWILILIIASCGFLFFSNKWIIDHTQGLVYEKIEDIPANDVGLLLGTSKRTTNGKINLFFKYRIEATVSLFLAGKIKHIIVSGDNRLIEYNEPREMRRALVKAGIPDTCITLDFAGFRTLDSVVRSKKVFGQKKITIISQKFHCQRAVFIALFHKQEAIAFCAQDVPESYSYFTMVREYLAKARAIIDVYFINQMPRFLGKQEIIKIN